MEEGAGLALLLPLGPPVLEPNLESGQENRERQDMSYAQIESSEGVQKWKVPSTSYDSRTYDCPLLCRYRKGLRKGRTWAAEE